MIRSNSGQNLSCCRESSAEVGWKRRKAGLSTCFEIITGLWINRQPQFGMAKRQLRFVLLKISGKNRWQRQNQLAEVAEPYVAVEKTQKFQENLVNC